ncbi:hypothetical protein RFM23_02800 [Mesorhizobium abyssinicae]|uniref:Uncharacterized protein n=1 Tax=Mesorhizobium abyssinicae TaxID=1209958 RepID=A0ABU5AGZ7_9HYPH|nr:hypothetical protein [Mesorhizobium abyssinicae]MDX8536544.1 hypothetical protein [Mesorhizobium abyssinicae]
MFNRNMRASEVPLRMSQGFSLCPGKTKQMSNTTLLVTAACLLLMLAIIRQRKGDILPNIFDLAGNILVVIFVAYFLRL